jgi:hypothetical protein
MSADERTSHPRPTSSAPLAAFRADAARDGVVAYSLTERWVRADAFPREAAVWRQRLIALLRRLRGTSDPTERAELEDIVEGYALAYTWLARGTGQPPSARRN